MASNETNRGGFTAGNPDRVDQAAQQSGIAEGLAEFVKLGSQAGALQQQLLAGIAQSQQREAKRLASVYPEGDPRIGRAAERAAQAQQLSAQAQSLAGVVGHAAETFQQDGLFNGYVHQADGTPATGCKVQLQLPGDKEVRSGDVDETGYFRIDLPAGADPNKPVSGASNWSARLMQAAGLDLSRGDAAGTGAAPVEATAAPIAAPTEATNVTSAAAAASTVHVLDAQGRVVFEDPAPPTFDPVRSEFRLYVLTDNLERGTQAAA